MKTAICAILKNEHRFLKEWIDWHLNLGFDAIHLFEDKGSESHEPITEGYANVFLRRYETDYELQRLLESQGSSFRQQVLYAYFAENSIDRYDRVAFIDIDEFITFAQDYNLDKLCNEFEPYPAVLLNWRPMGASGYIKRPSVGVVEAYKEEGAFSNQDHRWAYKSFVNINRYNGLIDLHRAKGYVNTNHEPDKDKHYYDKAWINHYFTKSWEDWCDRIFNRGGTQNGHRTVVEFFEANPSMQYLKEELLETVKEKIPKGTYWLDKSKRIIAGGNINKIMSMNGTPIIPRTNSKPSTLDEALNIAIIKASHLGFNSKIDKNKLIHFCWFGGAPFPKLAIKCIESWKKYMPQHTFCLWTEDSFDVDCIQFTKDAYLNRAWAFVSDYARLWATYHFGGIYLDTDVELIKSISDFPPNFFGLEKDSNSVAHGLGFACERHNNLIKEVMDEYRLLVFHEKLIDEINAPSVTTEVMYRLGYETNIDNIQYWNNFAVFPSEYLCPRPFTDARIEITENTRAIHHYMYSWKDCVKHEDDNKFKGVLYKVSDTIGVYAVSKCGCSTAALQTLTYHNRISSEMCDKYRNKHIEKLHVKAKLINRDIDKDKLIKVFIFRDPIERFVSAYHTLNFKDIGWNDFIRNKAPKLILHERHFVPQSEFIVGKDVDVYVDIKDYDDFCMEYGIPRRTSNVNDSEEYKRFKISVEDEEIIKNLYEKDYKFIDSIKKSEKLWTK